MASIGKNKAESAESVGSATRKCLNCGSEVSGKYCCECGQRVSTERLSVRGTLRDAVQDLTHINRGVGYTAWNLLVRPWIVVRDYVNGRRVRYTPPVSMLVIVCFIAAFVSGIVRDEVWSYVPIVESETEVDGEPVTVSFFVAIAHFISSAPSLQRLLGYLPVVFVVPLVYRRLGAARFNFAEYFMAMVYMACAYVIFGILVMPLELLINRASVHTIQIIYGLVICSMSLANAFPASRKRYTAGYLLLFLAATVITYILISILFAVCVVLIFDLA